MGMYVSFVRLTPAQLEQADRDPEWAEQYLEDLYDSEAEPLPENADVDIQKSWAGLDHLFDNAGVPFSIQEGGDCIANGDGWYLNTWTVEDVVRAAKVLKETSFDAIAEHCDAEQLSRAEVYPMRHMWDADDMESLKWDYEQLQGFFAAAAASGHAAMMSFG